MLIESAALGDVASVSQSLAKGVDPNVGDYDGRTALHVAATLGQMRVVEALLRSPTALVDVFDRWGKTPLQDASENGHEAVATFLRAHGATVKSAKAAKLLCTAAAAGNIDRLVRLLAEGSDINVSDYDGTALHLAASEGHAPAVRWLLLHGANAKALDGSAARLWTTHIARTGTRCAKSSNKARRTPLAALPSPVLHHSSRLKRPQWSVQPRHRCHRSCRPRMSHRPSPSVEPYDPTSCRIVLEQ